MRAISGVESDIKESAITHQHVFSFLGLKFRNMSNIIDTRCRFTISSYLNINVQYISEVRPIYLM